MLKSLHWLRSAKRYPIAQETCNIIQAPVFHYGAQWKLFCASPVQSAAGRPIPLVLHPPCLPAKDEEAWGNCMLLVDKPAGWTSSDVVVKLRGVLNVKKIGHAGTLDPLATGLLVVCIGKGTKSSQDLMSEHKVYSGIMRLGESTPSYDAETEIDERAEWEHLSDGLLQQATTDLTGEIMQVPPVYSAIRVGGVRMYEAARSGQDVKREPRKVNVFEYRVWREDENSQAKDGEAVGSKAHVRTLRRISSGNFHVDKAWILEDLIDVASRMGLGRSRRKRNTRHSRKKTSRSSEE